MNGALERLIDEPALGLKHRVRPNSADDGKNAPCLVLLHGVGANEQGLIDIAREQDPRLVVIVARAPLTFGSAQFGWFQVTFTANGPAINVQQAEASRRLLLEFVDALPDAYSVDPQRIWIAGFSQGGIMSASAALTAPEKFAGFGILSGRILPEIRPHVNTGDAVARLHAFISHGKADEKLGIHFAREARIYVDGLGIPLQYREYDAGHELNQSMRKDFQEWLSEEIK